MSRDFHGFTKKEIKRIHNFFAEVNDPTICLCDWIGTIWNNTILGNITDKHPFFYILIIWLLFSIKRQCSIFFACNFTSWYETLWYVASFITPSFIIFNCYMRDLNVFILILIKIVCIY